MKQIDYLRKSRKNCSALLMACALTFMLLTTTLSFAQTNSLTLGCPTANGNSYQYAALSLTAGDGVVRSISISFSENPDGCSIALPSTSWTVSGNEYSYYIIPAEGATSAQIQAFLQGVTFNVPNGTLKGVNIILSIDDASRQIFYFAGNGHYYEYVPYDGTKTWTIAYNEAKGKEYCGRPGYLATLTTADEDAFVTRIVQNAMWIGGTRLSPTDNATSTGTQYYADFDTEDQSSPETTDYWYWACGPEKGARITNEGAITNSDDDLDWYTAQPRQPNGYTNWMYQETYGIFGATGYSAEPNNNDATHGGESCLTILNLEKDNRNLFGGNVRFSEANLEIDGYVFGWNDVTYGGNNSSTDWRPKGYLVEYGDQSIGHSQTDEACSISASGLVGNATRTVKATLSGSTAVCAGEEATLNIIFEGGAFPFTGSVQGNNGEDVHFNTNDISYNFTVAPTATTSYTISTFSDASSTTGSNGCQGVYSIVYVPSGSATVTVNTPQVALNDIESVAICAGASTTLTATTTGTVTGEVSYAWSTGATGSEITVTPSETTTYTVTATATQGGCTATATKEVTVRVNTPQVALNDIASVSICAGANTTLTATTTGTVTGEVSYAWSTGATGSEITVTPSETTTYTVTATANYNGCTATATKSVTVTVNALPTAKVSVTDETCTGNDGTATVAAAGGNGEYTFYWSNDQSSATATNLSSSNGGTYTVTVTDGNNCVATATATIEFINNFTVSASNTAICSGATFTINPTASHTAKYSWAAPTATGITGATADTNASNISGTLTNTNTSATSITYTVAATTANGLCTADSFDVVVTVYAPVTGGSIQKDFIVCNGLDSVVTLTNEVLGNGGFNGAYIWQQIANGTTTTIEGANGETYTPTSVVGTVQYQRVYTTGCGNKPSNVVSVTYYGDVNPGTVVCSGEGNDCAANYCYGSDINVTLSTSGINVGSGTTPTIQWQQSVNGGDWTNISGANATTYTYNKNNFTEPIKFRYTIQLPSCDPVPSNNVHNIGVWALPVVSIADVATLCPSAASTEITGTIETPTTPNYTYYWSAGSGLTLPNLPDPNLPESATSAISNTITGTFPTADCNATYSASLYVEDGNGCKSNTATKTITVVDTVAPVISGTLDTINVEGCAETAAPAAYTTVAALRTAGLNITDNCGLQETVTSKQTSTGSCPIVITRTYTVKDLCGDSATVSQTININQADFDMPANDSSTVACPSATDTPPTLPTVIDACGDTLSPIGDPVVSTKPVCEGKRTYTYTYEDCAGHSHEWTYTYTIDMPAFEAIASQSATVDCPEDAVAPHTKEGYTMPVVTDACGNNVGYELTTSPSVVSCEGTMDYVYTYEDCAGNRQTFTYTYTIDMPTFAAIAPQTETVDCPAAAVAPHTKEGYTMPVVTDACGNNVNYVLTTTLDSVSCEGTKAYVYTYTDCAGNRQTFTYTYTIERADFTMPENAGKTIACASAIEEPTLPVVKDACGDTLTGVLKSGYPTATPSCEGDVVYVYTFTDCEGNTHDWTYTYTIEYEDFTMPENGSKTVACASEIVAPTLPTVTDKCGNALTGVLKTGYPTATPTCEGDVVYVYTFTDCEGNTHDWTYTYTIEYEDFTMPENGSKTVACASEIVAPTLPTVTDKCGNALTGVLKTSYPTATPTCEGTVTYVYTFTDCEGNTHDWTYTYTIEYEDFTMPENGSKTVACASEIVAPTLPTVTDKCGNALTGVLKSGYPTATPSCEGDVVYVYTFTDCAGHKHDWTYTYTIEREDFEMPDNDSSTVACASAIEEPTLPVVKDACGDTLTGVLKSGYPTATPSCEGTVTYVYTFTDCEGNTHDWTYTYTIEREDFTIPANTGSTVACIDDATVPTAPSVTDNCGNALTPSAAVEGGTYDGCEGTRTYTFTYTDCEGNSHDWVYTYTIERADFEMPADGSKTVACIDDATEPTAPSVTDNCGNALTPSTAVIGGTYDGCEGTRTYTFTYTDCEGNSHDWVYTYTIERADFEIPADGSKTVACASEISAPALPTVTDNCGDTLTGVLKEGYPTATPSCEGTVTYVYTFTDCEGNTHDWTYTYTIEREDFTIPENTGSTVACIADATVPTAPSVTDNCGNALTPSAAVEGGTYDGCEGTRTYTFTYTDCEGNTHDWTYTYTITAPTLTFTGSITDVDDVDACYSESHKSQLLTADQVKAMYSSSCSREISVEISDNVVSSSDCNWKITRTYNISDGGCNTDSQTMSVSGSDQTAPALAGTWPSDSTGQNSCLANADTTGLKDDSEIKALYSDCSTITVTHTDTIEGNACGWTVTRTYTIKDACGNTVTPAPTMSVSGSDQTAPVIDSINLDRTLTSTNCVFTIPDMREIVRNISTDCSEITVTQPSAGMVVYPMVAERDTTVNVIVTDSCGNSSVKEVVITIPAKVTISAMADPATICYGATSQLTATPSNVVGTETYNWTPSDDLNNATIANPVATLTTTTTYTVEVTDGNGCAATATTTVNVNPEVVMDTVAPMTLCVGDVTSYSFTTPLTVGTMSYAWTNSNNAIGLVANGDGDIPSFTPTNTTNAPINATITVTPSHTYNDIICVGDPINFTITVRPSIKTPGNVTFSCPADTTVVLSYSDCEQLVNIGEPEFVNHMSGMTVNITNDAPEGNIFPEGTTVVTWTATDDCGDTLTCTQNVVIQFPPCGDTIADFDGYRYSSVRIGCQCWTGENARSEHYSDGTPVDNFRYYNDSDSLENIYGKLYTWYTAVRVPEGDNNAEPSISTDPFGTTYVQGICPEGWALPTVNEYMQMIANSGDATHAKDGSNLYWLPGYEGQPPFSGFDAYGAGKYNGAIDRYQELLGKTYFWTTLSGSGSETATTVEINYYCAEGLQTELSKGDGVSIRCIRKR